MAPTPGNIPLSKNSPEPQPVEPPEPQAVVAIPQVGDYTTDTSAVYRPEKAGISLGRKGEPFAGSPYLHANNTNS
jgi:hypothetical protein